MADLTKDEAREELYDRLYEALSPNWEIAHGGYIDALDAVLSAPPEVLAAAMGGRYTELGITPAILLPPRPVDGEGE